MTSGDTTATPATPPGVPDQLTWVLAVISVAGGVGLWYWATCAGGNRYVSGFAISLVCGIAPTYLCSRLFHLMAGELHQRASIQDEATIDARWPMIAGTLERALITLLVGWSVSGAASFIIGWIAVKAVGGWQKWQKEGTPYSRAVYLAGLLGSLVSALVGVVAGLVVAQ